MKTFSITTLGCRVNHYESEQLATLLRGCGLVPADSPAQADLRIVHTCSVTVQAASKSRQAVRRNVRLNVLSHTSAALDRSADRVTECSSAGVTDPAIAIRAVAAGLSLSDKSSNLTGSSQANRPRVVVTGCWATSNPDEAAAFDGVDAVLGHHRDVDKELTHLLTQWQAEEASRAPTSPNPNSHVVTAPPEPDFDDKWMMQKAGTRAALITLDNEPHSPQRVKRKLEADENPRETPHEPRVGMVTLPQLGARQTGHQRAFLKVQDGCDAHCTYCIIPQLRPNLWSKPIDEAVDEAQRLVDAGHREIVLTGIFLGAYAQPTALRRRQPTLGSQHSGLSTLIHALCTRVHDLKRLRLSSLEPGDLTPDLIAVLKSHAQVVPHFHLPLQSGSDQILRRMNRQYTRDDFLRMADHVRAAFDRPAITTDIIVGFPGETDDEFARTLDVVERVRFIHVHAFSYSPRPDTAAARWTKQLIRGPVVNQRIDHLRELSADHSAEFRRQFVGQTVVVLVEHSSDSERDLRPLAGHQHGRCERYFAVHFPAGHLPPGAPARVRVDRVTPEQTFGTLVGVGQ